MSGHNICFSDEIKKTLSLNYQQILTISGPLATDYILMQPPALSKTMVTKVCIHQWVYKLFLKEIKRIQMRHFAVIQHIYLLSLPSIGELREACDSMLSLNV